MKKNFCYFFVILIISCLSTGCKRKKGCPINKEVSVEKIMSQKKKKQSHQLFPKDMRRH